MGSAGSTVDYTNARGGWSGAGEGNLSAEPLFVDVDQHDSRLMPGSPCIDAGDTSAVPAGLFGDLAGGARGVDDSATEDTGGSLSGVTVDMGAYEFGGSAMEGDLDEDGDIDLDDHRLFVWFFSGPRA